jgi:putative holliday junction resolvase
MRYLGVDYGSKKVGLALSDEAGTMGFPHAVVLNTPRLAEELAELARRREVGTIVIGESRTLSGAANPVAAAAHALGDVLGGMTGLPIRYESEVFTTAEARRAPEREVKTRRPQKRDAVDASAAALILTSYLTRIHHGS